jgi:hypothetical protein
MRGLLPWLALTSCTSWTKRDTALEVAFVAATAIDWHQTMSITAGCRELNPMIGRCGDVVPPNIYFPIGIVVHAALAVALPRPWREVFQSFTTGLEASTIFSNHVVGE